MQWHGRPSAKYDQMGMAPDCPGGRDYDSPVSDGHMTHGDIAARLGPGVWGTISGGAGRCHGLKAVM